jgi:cyanate lyase
MKKQPITMEIPTALEALSDIIIIASRARQLYENVLTGPTQDEAFVAALLHAIEALADREIREIR